MIEVFPALRLTLDDVHLRRGNREIASARQARVDIAAMSLFGGELRIDKLVLTQPAITVSRDREGHFDFEPAAPPAAQAEVAAQAWPDISLSAGSIAFVDAQQGKGFEARDCQGEVTHLQTRRRHARGPDA